MKIIFIGTSEFGIPTLEKLKASYELVLIITQPDKPVGRKQELTPPPVKVWATKNNIQTLQPNKIIEAKQQILEAQPDLTVVAAYGQIIPKEILDIPKFKSINIHGSLLPKYRGASPIQAAILNQEIETGVTLIQMDEKMDHGPIIAQAKLGVTEEDDYTSLSKKLAELGADLITKILPDWSAVKIKPHEQNHEQATFTKLIKREDARIVWSQSAKKILAQIKALNPQPGTWTMLDGKSIKIVKASIIKDTKIELPGKIYSNLGEMVVKTADNGLRIEQLIPEGKAAMNGKDFLNGLKGQSKLFI